MVIKVIEYECQVVCFKFSKIQQPTRSTMGIECRVMQSSIQWCGFKKIMRIWRKAYWASSGGTRYSIEPMENLETSHSITTWGMALTDAIEYRVVLVPKFLNFQHHTRSLMWYGWRDGDQV